MKPYPQVVIRNRKSHPWAVAAIWLFTVGACLWVFVVLLLVYG